MYYFPTDDFSSSSLHMALPVQEQTDLSALAQANGINIGCRDIQCYHCMNEQEALTLLRTMEGMQV
ncbi:MAG: hypothetical protein ACLT16_11665 [[Clostridium] innocuum]